MGIFRKSKTEKFFDSRSSRLMEIIQDCEFFGTAVLIVRPHAASHLYDNYVSMTAKYYLKNDGLVYLWARTSFDEFGPLKIEKWGYGFDNDKKEILYFDCVQFPWLLAIHEQTEGEASEWFNRYYGLEKGDMK